jgi:hypothetical protein
MVIEHTFITTLEPNHALGAASTLLQAGGFTVQQNSAFQVGGGWTDLEVSRGRKSEAYAKDVTQCPQAVRVEWDRGRVVVAASITQKQRKGRGFKWSGNSSAVTYPLSGAPAKDRVYADLMLVITRALELLLVQQLPPEQAMQSWMMVEQQMKEESRRDRRRGNIIILSILGVFFAIIIIVIAVAVMH